MTRISNRQVQPWDPSLSVLPIVMELLPAVIDALNAPIQHNHTHSHTINSQPSQPRQTVNPYRQSQSVPQTVGQLEQWLLDKPRDPDIDRLLQMLASWHEDTPTAAIKHLLT